MKRMGFTFDPGPLPFTTIRRLQWANRTWVGELIEIHGEHGCTMPPTAAFVEAIERYTGPPPAHLAAVYAGERLCVITLRKPAARWEKRGEDWYLVGKEEPA